VTLELRPLDDLRFQDLVTRARKRVAVRCPEWDEHNVSDPGITLIEEFASMIEMLGYRIDRIPERLHVALLRLLDIELAPPVAATAALEFRLAAAAERGRQDDLDRLLDVDLVARQRDPAAIVDAEREREAAAEDRRHPSRT